MKPSETTAIYAALCKNKPPFDNLKVRQAINYAIDRDQINQLLYQGTSQPMWGDWTTESAYFNPKNDKLYAYNPKKAKKLLKEAGVENLTYDLMSNSTPDTTRVGEIMKEQMAEAGITVEPDEHHQHRPGLLHRPEVAVGADPAPTRRPRQGHPQPAARQHR